MPEFMFKIISYDVLSFILDLVSFLDTNVYSLVYLIVLGANKCTYIIHCKYIDLNT